MSPKVITALMMVVVAGCMVEVLAVERCEPCYDIIDNPRKSLQSCGKCKLVDKKKGTFECDECKAKFRCASTDYPNPAKYKAIADRMVERSDCFDNYEECARCRCPEIENP
ncbi:unnamed protein product [Owenia fusiformis]|uniref:Uncharacterized protein n=1 Tax=Owenia fusiformis TaxID=6347 RepID=A0A8S4PAA5_OWEFU|nr:unnamed protein product [Owenia fusiformis]